MGKRNKWKYNPKVAKFKGQKRGGRIKKGKKERKISKRGDKFSALMERMFLR